MNLHGQIMNIKCDPCNVAAGFDAGTLTRDQVTHYKLGHKDARHAAAELALAGDACADALRLFMGAGLGNSTDFAEQAKAYQAGLEALARLRG